MKKEEVRKYIRVPKTQIKYFKMKELCDIYGIPYHFRKSRSWIAREIYKCIAKEEGIERDYEELASKAYMLWDIGQSILETEYKHLSGDILMTHPLKTLSEEENILLGAALNALAVNKESINRENSFVNSGMMKKMQKKALKAIIASADLARSMELADVTDIVPDHKSECLFYVMTGNQGKEETGEEAEAFWWKKYYGKIPYRFSKREKERQAEESLDAAAMSIPAGTGCLKERTLTFLEKQIFTIEMLSVKDNAAFNADTVHDIRVAFRNLLSFSTAFSDYLTKDWKKEFIPRFKLALKELGAARDFDVMRENINLFLEKENYKAEQFPIFDKVFTAKHKEKQEAVKTYFKSEEKQQYFSLFQRYIAEDNICKPAIEKGARVSEYRMKAVLAEVTRNSLSEILAYKEWLRGILIPEPMLHQLRIVLKRLRYALSFFEEDLGRREKVLMQDCKEMQDLIGNLHDKEVLIKQLQSNFLNLQGSTGSDIELVCKIIVSTEMEIDVLSEQVLIRWNKFLKKYEKK